jgi:hypothetical protein
MDPRQKKPGGGACARIPDATLSFGVHDPHLEGASFISPPLRLYALRQHLANFTLAHSNDAAGFNFENFTRNVRGMKYLELEGQGYEVLFTRSAAFLTFHGAPGGLLAISHIIGDEALSRVNVASGKGPELLTICRITGRELGALLAASTRDRTGPFNPDSILPSDPARDVDPAEFREKMANCSVVSSDGQFDLAAFSARINIVSVFLDENDAGYFVIGMRGDESVYSMYVNVNAPSLHEENPIVARLRYNNDSLTLFRVEVIG